VILEIKRDPNRLYGERRLNRQLQVPAEQSAEAVVSRQKVRRDLKNLKDILYTITKAREGTDEEEDGGAEMR
jgi:hypothetical protein